MVDFDWKMEFINPLSTWQDSWQPGEVPCSFFVHTSIINKWEKIMNKMFANSNWEMYEHILQIGSKLFEMRLIIILRATKDQLNFLCDSIENSQYSFPWEEKPTLFIEVANFCFMKKFIKNYNLEAYILKIEEKVGYFVYGDQPINVITFNESVSAKLDIIQKFKMSSKWRYNLKDTPFFMAYGFPWQQYNFLQKIHLNDYFYSTLPIILSHLGTLNYAGALDMKDLLSLRLAMSDVRDPSKSNHLIDEIDFMIKRELPKLIKNNHLSLHKYMVTNNIILSKLLTSYLVYEFQNFFKTLDMSPLHESEVRDTIKLTEEIDVFKILQERFNVDYSINGNGFDKMSLSLFVGLIESRNVYEIELDTNYKWINNVSIFEPNRIIAANKQVYITLKGKNTFNFIEGFVAELKTITFDNFTFTLHIDECNLNDYRIFDNLKDSAIKLYGIKVDLNMLENLEQCNIEPMISLYPCSLEYTCRNWQLLNNIGKIREVRACEDEDTWLSMFEFILKEIRKSNTNEFQFGKNDPIFEISQQGNHYNRIFLNKMKFTIDEQNSKLEIREVYTNKIIDLYCKIYHIQEKEKSDYEFYE